MNNATYAIQVPWPDFVTGETSWLYVLGGDRNDLGDYDVLTFPNEESAKEISKSFTNSKVVQYKHDKHDKHDKTEQD